MSVTLTAKFAVPATAGFPWIKPVEASRTSPPGSDRVTWSSAFRSRSYTQISEGASAAACCSAIRRPSGAIRAPARTPGGSGMRASPPPTSRRTTVCVPPSLRAHTYSSAAGDVATSSASQTPASSQVTAAVSMSTRAIP